jgi:hypothetical protein
MVYVADNGRCIGFHSYQGPTWIEALDAAEKSLGLFQSQADAAKAVFQREDLHDEGVFK